MLLNEISAAVASGLFAVLALKHKQSKVNTNTKSTFATKSQPKWPPFEVYKFSAMFKCESNLTLPIDN